MHWIPCIHKTRCKKNILATNTCRIEKLVALSLTVVRLLSMLWVVDHAAFILAACRAQQTTNSSTEPVYMDIAA
jgi:hypothetical protein